VGQPELPEKIGLPIEHCHGGGLLFICVLITEGLAHLLDNQALSSFQLAIIDPTVEWSKLYREQTAAEGSKNESYFFSGVVSSDAKRLAPINLQASIVDRSAPCIVDGSTRRAADGEHDSELGIKEETKRKRLDLVVGEERLGTRGRRTTNFNIVWRVQDR